MNYRSLLLSLCVLLVSSCSSQTAYEEEGFAIDSPFRQKVKGKASDVCESARRSLLGQGYLIESASEEDVKARKATKGGDTENTFIEMNIVCLPDAKGTTLFATGLVTEYDLKKSTSSASVGVSALGSISLPIGQSADSLVKISEVTIESKNFYQRFFEVVSTILEEMQEAERERELELKREREVESALPAAAEATQSESPPVESTVTSPDPGEPAPVSAPEPVSAEPAEPESQQDQEAPEPLSASEKLPVEAPKEPAPAIESAPAIPTETVSGDEVSEMTMEDILQHEAAIKEEPLPTEEALTEIVPAGTRKTPSTVSEPDSTPIPGTPAPSSDPLDELF